MSSSSMGIKVRASMKRAVVSMPLRPLVSLEKICWGLRFRKGIRDRGTEAIPYFRDRFDLYNHLNDFVLRRAPVDFLEFGVFRGESIRAWTSLTRIPIPASSDLTSSRGCQRNGSMSVR